VRSIMFMWNRGRRACILVILLTLAGCTPPPQPPARPHRFTTTGPASRPAAEKIPEGLPLLLRTALLPPITPQPFAVTLDEQLETQPEAGPPSVQELHIELSGTLRGETPLPRADSKAVLVLETIAVHYRGPESPRTLDYDSEAPAGDPSRLGDILSKARGTELSVLLTPRARIRELSGLDAIWRSADVLRLAPAARTVLNRFRDQQMGELLGEALFPPMPGGQLGPGDRWESESPADIAGIAPLTSVLTGRIARTSTAPEGLPIIHLQITGTLKPSTIAVGWSSGRRVEVRKGVDDIALAVDWNTRSLQQESRREVELTKPLDTQLGALLIIRQHRTLKSSRGRIETASE
jgi:hypothetical protein